MNHEDIVRDLLGRFSDKKVDFLESVEGEIRSYIGAQGKGCLTIVERRPAPASDLEWELRCSLRYVGRLTAFCRKKTVDGHELDSALTQPVVEIVTKKLEQLYERESEQISDALITYIVNDKVLCKTLALTILGSVSGLTVAVRDRAAAQLVRHLREFIEASTGQTISNLVTKLVATTSGKAIGMQVAALILKSLSTQAKFIIAKSLTSGVLKTAIGAAVKKFILATVAAAIIKAIAVKFGLTVGAASTIVLLPIIAAFIAYQVAGFPEELAKKVSINVTSELSGNFESMNTDILKTLVDNIIGAGFGAVALEAASSSQLQSLVGEIVKRVSGEGESNA